MPHGEAWPGASVLGDTRPRLAGVLCPHPGVATTPVGCAPASQPAGAYMLLDSLSRATSAATFACCLLRRSILWRQAHSSPLQ